MLVTASDKNPQLSGYTEQAHKVNAYLHSLAGPRTVVADWAEEANEHCGEDWPDEPCDWFDADQLHVSYAGIAARNDEIIEAVNRCPD